MNHQNEVIYLSETETLILTTDVAKTHAELIDSGMKNIMLPRADTAFGMKAFVQDVSGVVSEIRLKTKTS